MLKKRWKQRERYKTTTIGLISKRKRLFTCSTLFCTFLCFVRLEREISRNFLVTRFMEEMLYVFLYNFLFHCRSFSPWWPPAFLIFLSHRPIKFSCFSSKEIGLRCFFIPRSSSFPVFHVNVHVKIEGLFTWARLTGLALLLGRISPWVHVRNFSPVSEMRKGQRSWRRVLAPKSRNKADKNFNFRACHSSGNS